MNEIDSTTKYFFIECTNYETNIKKFTILPIAIKKTTPITIENVLKLPLGTYMDTIFGKSIPWGSFPFNCPETPDGKCGGHKNYIVHHIKTSAE